MRLTKSWNEFMERMLEAKRAWKEHQELLMSSTRVEIESQPVDAQRFLGLYERMDFEVMLGSFAFYCLTSGGMETLVVKVEEEEKKEIIKEEVKEDARKRK